MPAVEMICLANSRKHSGRCVAGLRRTPLVICCSRPRTARPRPITPSWRGSVNFGGRVPSRFA